MHYYSSSVLSLSLHLSMRPSLVQQVMSYVQKQVTLLTELYESNVNITFVPFATDTDIQNLGDSSTYNYFAGVFLSFKTRKQM